MRNSDPGERKEAGADRLLADLEAVASRLDRRRYPGRAWPAESMTGRPKRRRFIRWYTLAPAGAIAALLLVGLMLRNSPIDRPADQAPDLAPTGVHAQRTAPDAPTTAPVIQVASRRVPTAAEVRAGGFVLPLPAAPDAAVLAYVAIDPPDVGLIVPAVPQGPAVPEAPRPGAYRWSIPNIRIPSL